MTTQLPEVRRPAEMVPRAAETERLWHMLSRVQDTEMVPEDLRGHPDRILAVALAGREIGLGPFESLRNFYIVDGRPTESAELHQTLADRAGHPVFPVEISNVRVVYRGRNREWPEDAPWVEIAWDAETAAIAGLVDWDCVETWPRHADKEVTRRRRDGGTYKKKGCDCKDNWRKYPRAMLRSRACSEMVRTVCPEVLVGATYTPEEIGATVTGPGGVPPGAARGFGATGEQFEVPHVDDIDGMWVARHTPDQVLAVVDHYGPDLPVEGAGGTPLARWVKQCEQYGDKRPRLLEGLDVRLSGEVVDAEVVEPDEPCGVCGAVDPDPHDGDAHEAATAPLGDDGERDGACEACGKPGCDDPHDQPEPDGEGVWTVEQIAAASPDWLVEAGVVDDLDEAARAVEEAQAELNRTETNGDGPYEPEDAEGRGEPAPDRTDAHSGSEAVVLEPDVVKAYLETVPTAGPVVWATPVADVLDKVSAGEWVPSTTLAYELASDRPRSTLVPKLEDLCDEEKVSRSRQLGRLWQERAGDDD